MSNLLDYSGWTPGTGGSTGFEFTGSSEEESVRLIDRDPGDRLTCVWTIDPIAGIGYSGGFHTGYKAIDINYMYRISVWTKRTAVFTTSRTLFGINTGGNATLIDIVTNVENTNAYLHFYTGGVQNEWVLMVGHVHETGYSSTTKHSDSGIWKTDGSQYEAINWEYKWYSANISVRQRTFYYEPIKNTNVRMLWCYPRIDKCDGTQPSLEALINGWEKGAMVAGILFK